MTDKLRQNTVYFTLASVGQKIIAFVYFLFLARIMMPEATGEYFLAISITTMFSVVADFGITAVLIREIAKDETKVRTYVQHGLGIKLPLMILGALGAGIAGNILGYPMHIQTLIWLATIVLAIDALQVFFYGILRGLQILQHESLGVFLGMGTTAVIGGLSLWIAPSLPNLVFALIAGSVINLIAGGREVIKRIGWRGVIPSWSVTTKSLIMTAIPFGLAGVFVKVYSYIDSVFISKLVDVAAVGQYAIAYKFTYAFQFLPLAFIAALYPALSAVVGKDAIKLKHTFNKSMWYMAVLSAPIVFGLYAIAPEVVLLVGEGYEEAAPVLKHLVVVLIPIFLDFPIGALLNASNRQVTKTTVMGLTMVLNVVLNALLIPWAGIQGAAWAAIGSFSFMLLADLYFVPKCIPNYQFRDLLKSIVPIYGAGLLMLVVVVLLKPIIGWMPVILVGAIIYLLALMLFGSLRLEDIRQWRRV